MIYERETAWPLKRDDRSSKMRTENVSFSGWQCESHFGNLNKVISEEWRGMKATLECIQVRMRRERTDSNLRKLKGFLFVCFNQDLENEDSNIWTERGLDRYGLFL